MTHTERPLQVSPGWLELNQPYTVACSKNAPIHISYVRFYWRQCHLALMEYSTNYSKFTTQREESEFVFAAVPFSWQQPQHLHLHTVTVYHYCKCTVHCTTEYVIILLPELKVMCRFLSSLCKLCDGEKAHNTCNLDTFYTAVQVRGSHTESTRSRSNVFWLTVL